MGLDFDSALSLLKQSGIKVDKVKGCKRVVFEFEKKTITIEEPELLEIFARGSSNYQVKGNAIVTPREVSTNEELPL